MHIPVRSLALVLIVSVMPVAVAAQNITLTSAGGLSFGGGASVTTQPDGRRLASNGDNQKTCEADQIAVAATVPVTIVTVDGSKTYGDGMVGCFDLSQFNGAVVVKMEERITLRPSS